MNSRHEGKRKENRQMFAMLGILVGFLVYGLISQNYLLAVIMGMWLVPNTLMAYDMTFGWLK